MNSKKIFHVHQDPVLKILSISPEITTVDDSNPRKLCKIPNYFSRKCFSNFLITWFNISYFLCIVPFRFTRNAYPDGEGKNVFSLVKNPLQMVLCGLVHFGTFMIYLGEMRQGWVPRDSHNNPVKFLNMFMGISSVVSFSASVHIFWTKSSTFHKIVENLAVRRRAVYRYAGYQRLNDSLEDKALPNWIPFFIIMVYATLGFISPIAASRLSIDPQGVLQSFESRLKYYYFLTTKFPQPPKLMDRNVTSIFSVDFSKLDPKILTTFLITFTWRSLLGFLTDALILCGACSLFWPVRDVTNFLRDVMKGRWGHRNELVLDFQDVMEEYQSLKELSDLVNAALRTLFFTFVIEGILFHSSSLKNLFTNSGMGSIYLGFFFFSFCLNFHVAAHICQQMATFKTWIMQPKNRKEIGTIDLFIIIQELNSNPVGLSGRGRFVIDYALMASVCNTLLTYFVVTVQYSS